MDCSRTISVGQNAHHLAKNSVPANNGNRECVLRVTGIRLLMIKPTGNFRNLYLYCKSLDGTRPLTVCYTLCCLATIHPHSGSGTFRPANLTVLLTFHSPLACRTFCQKVHQSHEVNSTVQSHSRADCIC